MKKVLLTLVLLFVLAGGAFIWLWNLGTPPTLAASTARLDQVSGTVETRSNAQSGWSPASNGQAVTQGMQIRTGADGTVTLAISGVSQTRLSTSTELTIDALVLPQATSTKSETRLVLTAGRTWSRIVRLLELDSSYTVQTDDVVATVRGTAFALTKERGRFTNLAVYDGTVKAADKWVATGMAMRAGRGTMQMAPAGRLMTEPKAWIENNLVLDKSFLKETKTNLQTHLLQGVSPTMYQLVGEQAEKLHLAVANEVEKRDLEAQYMTRKLAMAKMWEEAGNTQAAKEVLEQVKQGLETRVGEVSKDTVQKSAWPTEVKQILIQASVLYQGETNQVPVDFLQEKIEAMKKEGLTIPLLQIPSLPPKEDLLKLVPSPTTPVQEAPKSQPIARAPEKLIVTATQTTLGIKERTQLLAKLIYSTGETRDVTDLTSFVSSDPSIGLIVGSAFQATEQPGSVRVTATYRENEQTVMSAISFEITK